MNETDARDLSSQALRRSIRLISILRCAHDAGFRPVPGAAVHTIAYLADALSPVWGLPLLDSHVLKNSSRPNFPALQRDLDGLVGRGMVEVHDLVFSSSGKGTPIRASFALTELASPAVQLISTSEYFKRQLEFIREVTFAAAALGDDGLAGVGTVDASYSDPFADVGSVIDLSESTDSERSSAAVAQRFRELAPQAELSDAQLVHLYLRHLYARLRVA